MFGILSVKFSVFSKPVAPHPNKVAKLFKHVSTYTVSYVGIIPQEISICHLVLLIWKTWKITQSFLDLGDQKLKINTVS